MKLDLRWTVATFVGLASSLGGCDCGKKAAGQARTNNAPVAVAGADRQILVDSMVTLDGSASSDVDGDALTYAWRQDEGTDVTLSAPAAEATDFTAPSAPETLRFTLTVNDGSVDAEDQVTLFVVTMITNQPPVADAGADRTVQSQAQVTLDGSASSDPDMDPLTYSWVQISGPAVTLTGEDTVSPSFTSPTVTDPTVLEFVLEVNDGTLTSAPDSVVITVNPGVLNNLPPTADAGMDQAVDMLTLVTLDSSASSDPEMDPLTFTWVQSSGPVAMLSDNTAPQPTFTAPVVLVDTDLVFSLSVNDGNQDSGPDTVTITVRHVNRVPQVDSVMPMSPQSIDEGGSVSYTVTFSDADGDMLVFTDNCAMIAYVTCTAMGNVVTVDVSPPAGTGADTANITITADDGTATTDAMLVVNVNDVNFDPTAMSAPPGPYDVTEDAMMPTAAVVTFTDADMDTLVLDLSGCAAHAWLDCVESSPGVVDVTINAIPNDMGGDTITVTLTADDGNMGTASHDLIINVLDSVAPMVSFTGLNASPNHVTNEGAMGAPVDVVVTDSPDDDTPFTCAAMGPIWVTYDDMTKQLNFAPVMGDTEGTVTLTCTDADGSTGMATFDALINDPPTAAFSLAIDPPPAGATVVLVDGTSDPDMGDVWTCQWTATVPFVGADDICTGAELDLSAIDCGDTFDVTLDVTDTGGLMSSAGPTMFTASGGGPFVVKRAVCTNACGSQVEPWCTIQEGIASGFPDIFVATSLTTPYDDNPAGDGALVMASGVSLHGGYDSMGWGAPPDRFANPTLVDLQTADGIEIDGLTDITVEGFDILLVPNSLMMINAPRSAFTLTNTDDTVVINDNSINANIGMMQPMDTNGITLVGNVASVITANTILGGDGTASSTAIRYTGAAGESFTGVIADHRWMPNGILGGVAPDAAGLRMEGPVDATASITNNDIDGGGGMGTALSKGILFAGPVDMVLGGNNSITGGTGDESVGVDYAAIGAMGTAVIDGEPGIDGGAGQTVTLGVRAVGPGTVEIRDSTILGGVGPTQFSAGVGLQAMAGTFTALFDGANFIVGGQTALSPGAAAYGVFSDGLDSISFVGGLYAGSLSPAVGAVGIGVNGPGSATLDGVFTAGAEAGGTATGVEATNDVDLTVINNSIVIGGGLIGTGIAYEVGDNPTGFTIGGADVTTGNTITGAWIGAGSGLPQFGGILRTGIRVLVGGGSQLTGRVSTITNNAQIFGGMTDQAPGALGEPQSRGIHISDTGNILIEGNALIQGCYTRCSGDTGNAFVGVGIEIDGDVAMDDPAMTGGIVDNARIAGGPIEGAGAATPQVAGIYLDQPFTSGTPNVVATGNIIIGNDNDNWDLPDIALGVGVTGGDLQLGLPGAGNTIDGGWSVLTSVGVAVNATTINAANLAAQANPDIWGNSDSANIPNTAAAVAVGFMGPMGGNNASLLTNTRISGGFGRTQAIGVVYGPLSGGGPIIGNNIAGGVSGGTATGLHLQQLAPSVTKLVVDRNLIEACGEYRGMVHSPDCEIATRSRGLFVNEEANLRFSNNRVFGGYAVPTSPTISAAAVDVQGAAGGIAMGDLEIVHNYLDGQGAATSNTSAVTIGSPNGFTGAGVYFVNNLLDNGTLGNANFHFIEFCFADITMMNVFNNAFQIDPDGAAVYYRECTGFMSLPNDFGQNLIGANTPALGCATLGQCAQMMPMVCMDDVASGIGAYQCNGASAITLATATATLRATPRNFGRAAYEITGSMPSITAQGFTTVGMDALGLADVTTDFQNQMRMTPPDPGHDE